MTSVDPGDVRQVIEQLRAVAEREAPPEFESQAEGDAASEDVPEVTWQELGEMSALMRRAADLLSEQRERAEKAESEVERIARQVEDLAQDRVTADAEAAQLRGEVERLKGKLAREDRAHGDTIDARDRAQAMADLLAERIVDLTVGGDTIEAIGEHTSANCPWQRAIELADEHLTSPSAPSGWQPIESAPQMRKVIVTYINALGKRRVVMGCYYLAHSLEMHDDYAEVGVYDEATGESFTPEGWYDEHDSDSPLMPLSEPPTHWMPLPPAPTQDHPFLGPLTHVADVGLSVDGISATASGEDALPPAPEASPAKETR